MHSISWFDSKDSGVNLNLFGQIINANPEVGVAVRRGASVRAATAKLVAVAVASCSYDQ